jgi:5-methylcytosine-specific restriction endonuclease McrA
MMQNNDRFRELHQSDQAKKIYRSQRWTELSRRYRHQHPICNRCHAVHRIQVSELIHHIEPLESVLARKGDPFDESNLEAICFECHQSELNAKREVNVRKRTAHDVEYVMCLQKR